MPSVYSRITNISSSERLKLISATTAPVNLGQTDWSDDESDDELKIENTDPENVEVTDANKGLVIKLKYHRVLLPYIDKLNW